MWVAPREQDVPAAVTVNGDAVDSLQWLGEADDQPLKCDSVA